MTQILHYFDVQLKFYTCITLYLYYISNNNYVDKSKAYTVILSMKVIIFLIIYQFHHLFHKIKFSR